MDHVPMLRAAAARAAIQIREFSEIFLKLSMFEFDRCDAQDHPSTARDPILALDQI